MKESERRRNTRVLFQATTDLQFADKAYQQCETSDLSLKGVFIPGLSGHQMGEKCDIILNLTGMTSDIKLRMKGEVVRVVDTGIALHFVEIDLDSFLHLKNIVYYNSEDPDKLHEEFVS